MQRHTRSVEIRDSSFFSFLPQVPPVDSSPLVLTRISILIRDFFSPAVAERLAPRILFGFELALPFLPVIVFN